MTSPKGKEGTLTLQVGGKPESIPGACNDIGWITTHKLERDLVIKLGENTPIPARFTEEGTHLSWMGWVQTAEVDDSNNIVTLKCDAWIPANN